MSDANALGGVARALEVRHSLTYVADNVAERQQLGGLRRSGGLARQSGVVKRWV